MLKIKGSIFATFYFEISSKYATFAISNVTVLFMKASELIKLLKGNGWQEVRQVGSHVIMKHDDNPNNLSVPLHGKKDVKPGTLNSLLKKAGVK